jgi:hypothetical protein
MDRAGMANTEQPGKRTSGLVNLALALLFTGISLWLADLAFRYYERNHLVMDRPDIEGAGPVNLAALSYNDGLVERRSGEGEFRILSFGDSFTYSVMEPQLSYSGIVQQRLDQAVDQYRFRVINLGEPATGNRHFRAAYDFWSQVLEHDAVLFHIFLGNDVLDDAYLYSSVVWAPNDAVLKGGNPVLDAANARVPHKYPLRMFDYAFAYWMSARTRSDNALPEGYNWAGLTSFEPQVFNEINFQYLENFDPLKLPDLLPGYEQVRLLLQRAQQVSEAGKSVAVILGPSEPQVDDGLRATVLKVNHGEQQNFDMELPLRIIQRLKAQVAPDVMLLDLTPYFRENRAQTGQKLFFRRNTHWDGDGNRLAGDVIADHLLAGWFGQTPPLVRQTELSYRNELLGDAEIDAYLQPLTAAAEKAGLAVNGVFRSVHLFDGIIGRTDNWAIAALDQPVMLEFDPPRKLSAMRLHMFRADGRTYRYTVEAEREGQWQMVSDHSAQSAGGTQDIALGGAEISAIRMIGLYNSSQENDPANAYFHIEEIELID